MFIKGVRKIKLIISDLDGTLFNGKGQISLESKKAIEQAQKKGITFAIASGRSFNSVAKAIQSIGLKCPIICSNGAEIYSEEGQLIKTSPLKKHVSKKVIDLCKVKDVYFEIYTNKGNIVMSYQQYLYLFVENFQTIKPDLEKEELLLFAKKGFIEENMCVLNDDSEQNDPNLSI